MRLRSDQAKGPLRGTLRPPGDKSISHRALMFAGLADGRSEIEGLLQSADTAATRMAMQQLGANYQLDDGTCVVDGVGSKELREVPGVLGMGNSGTAMRLLAGVLAGYAFTSRLSGDASLNQRPMGRIARPLIAMGAQVETTAAGTAPLVIRGRHPLKAMEFRSEVASAQVKSCVLLAGLRADGVTRVVEPLRSRDHTERMLPEFGVTVGEDVSIQGGQMLLAARIRIPADPSSAAFLIAAALLIPGSDIELTDVGLNDTRSGFFRAVEAMGAKLEIRRQPGFGGEPAGTIRVRYQGRLSGIDLPEDWLPSMIDEVPVLLALAACAEGTSRISGAAELRVKESDRLAVMSSGLLALGASIKEAPDGLTLVPGPMRPGSVDAHLDHRCAMSFAVLGQTIAGGIEITGAENIDTSYPGFVRDMQALGAALNIKGDDQS